jgi:diacyltrehalose acyltransferase
VAREHTSLATGATTTPRSWSRTKNTRNKPLKRTLAAVGALAAMATVVAPLARADPTVLLVGGTYIPGLSSIVGQLDAPTTTSTTTSTLLQGYFGSDPVVTVSYPASFWPLSGLNSPTLGSSVATGTTNLATAIGNQGNNETIVVGISQGTLVADAEQAQLRNDPNAPPPNQLTFVMIGDPDRGNGAFSVLFPAGTFIPILNFVVQRPVASQYNTIVVANQYDGVGDFPDRPWDLVAVVNALLGGLFIHPGESITDNLAAVPPQDITVTTNPNGTTTTTYFVPAQQLPLTEPLTDLGVPGWITSALDKILTPVIDAGYSRYDSSDGIKAPYLSNGQLVFPKPSNAKTGALAQPPTMSSTLSSVSTPKPQVRTGLAFQPRTRIHPASTPETHKKK